MTGPLDRLTPGFSKVESPLKSSCYFLGFGCHQEIILITFSFVISFVVVVCISYICGTCAALISRWKESRPQRSHARSRTTTNNPMIFPAGSFEKWHIRAIFCMLYYQDFWSWIGMMEIELILFLKKLLTNGEIISLVYLLEKINRLYHFWIQLKKWIDYWRIAAWIGS